MHEEDFCCSICLDVFIEPQIVQCGHTFCRFCIEEALNITNYCPICRMVAGRVVPNRQMESVTIRWMQDNGKDEEYVKKKEKNRRMISLGTRALVILWTTLSSRADKSMRLFDILNMHKIDPSLKGEVVRQVSMQKNVGLKVEEHESGDHLIKLLEADNN